MKKFILVLSAIAALVVTPIAVASIGNATMQGTQANAGYCKSGAYVKNVKACKENGGRR